MPATPENPSAPTDVTPPGETVAVADEALSVSPAELLARLDERLKNGDGDWKTAVLETIGHWPAATEEHNGSTLAYQIGSEAFDWRLLARRIIESVTSGPSDAEWHEWLDTPELFAGFDEPTFKRALGVDKFRANLNFFYGVWVEQALVTAVQEEIVKRRVASGRAPTDERCDEAYPRLYGAPCEELWDRYSTEHGIGPARPGWRHQDERSLADDDGFTYWLFKRRIERLDPARVASDTRKGLGQLEKMRQAHEKRRKLMRDGSSA